MSGEETVVSGKRDPIDSALKMLNSVLSSKAVLVPNAPPKNNYLLQSPFDVIVALTMHTKQIKAKQPSSS